MRQFDVYYTDKCVTVEEVREAVVKEVDGPGKLYWVTEPCKKSSGKNIT